MSSLPLALAVVVLVSTTSPAAQDPQVFGRVVDGAGKPIAGVEVQSSWGVMPPRFEPGNTPAKSDREGRFAITWSRSDMPYAVVGFTPDRAEGFAVVVEPGTPLVECRLQPTIEWRARLRCPDLGLSKVGTTVFVRDAKDRVNVGFVLHPHGGDLHLVLPAGDWLLCTNGDDLARLRLPLHLDAAHREVTTNVDIPAAAWAKQIGQPFPEWQVTAARNAPPSLRVVDHRGRWLLIAFLRQRLLTSWDEAMPKLAALHADPALAKKLAVVAILEQGPADFAAVDASYAKMRERRGWPELPPVPLLLDGDGATQKLLGVDRFPLMLLVDPNGQLWGSVDRWNAADVAIVRAAVQGDLPRREPPAFRGLGERSEAEQKDAAWHALPVEEEAPGFDAPASLADSLLRNRRWNPYDTYIASERRTALQELLAAAAPELNKLKHDRDTAVSEAFRAAVEARRIVPMHEGLLTAAEKATVDLRAGQDAEQRAEWCDRLLSFRTPHLRRTTIYTGRTKASYFWSMDDVPAAKPARDAYVKAREHCEQQVVKWFEDAGALPRADAAALRLLLLLLRQDL